MDKGNFPSFYFKCCYHRVQEPISIKLLEDKIVIYFKCFFCGKEVILESKDGIKIETIDNPKGIKVFYITETGKKEIIDNGIGFGC